MNESSVQATWKFFANPSSKKDVDLQGLAHSARESFAIVERWKITQTTITNEVVVSTVARVLNQTRQYYEAITISVDAADEGFNFASDATEFCDRLAQATESPESLTEGLREMEQMAERAHHSSLAMNMKFRMVRVNMFEILKEIPYHTEQFKTSSNPRLLTVSPNPAMVTSSLDDPPPPDQNNIEITNDRSGLQNVLGQLQKVNGDLETLLGHVGSFVDWWGDMKQSLHHLEMVIPKIRTDGSNPFRTGSVAESWKSVRESYALYRKQISEVQDFYFDLAPTAALESTVHDSISDPRGTFVDANARGPAETEGERQVEIVIKVHEQRTADYTPPEEPHGPEVNMTKAESRLWEKIITEEERRSAVDDAEKRLSKKTSQQAILGEQEHIEENPLSMEAARLALGKRRNARKERKRREEEEANRRMLEDELASKRMAEIQVVQLAEKLRDDERHLAELEAMQLARAQEILDVELQAQQLAEEKRKMEEQHLAELHDVRVAKEKHLAEVESRRREAESARQREDARLAEIKAKSLGEQAAVEPKTKAETRRLAKLRQLAEAELVREHLAERRAEETRSATDEHWRHEDMQEFAEDTRLAKLDTVRVTVEMPLADIGTIRPVEGKGEVDSEAFSTRPTEDLLNTTEITLVPDVENEKREEGQRRTTEEDGRFERGRLAKVVVIEEKSCQPEPEEQRMITGHLEQERLADSGGEAEVQLAGERFSDEERMVEDQKVSEYAERCRADADSELLDRVADAQATADAQAIAEQLRTREAPDPKGPTSTNPGSRSCGDYLKQSCVLM